MVRRSRSQGVFLCVCNVIKSDSYFEDLPRVEHLKLSEEWTGLVPLLPSISAAGNGQHAKMIHRWTRLFGSSSAQNSTHRTNN